MKKNNTLYITLGISLFLFTFITFLIYLVYCYAYYDKNLENIYTDLYNQKEYAKIYENMSNEAQLSRELYNIPLNLMYDKNNLKNIYYTYYKETSMFTLETFLNTYYYGDVIIDRNNINFEYLNKTSLIHRAKIKYNSINLKSAANFQTSLGLKKNITFKIENNASVFLDGEKISCDQELCQIEAIFGGLHKINYKSNNKDYFTLVSIKENNEVIDISTIDTLITTTKEIEISVPETPIVAADLNLGTYKINKCYLESSCASKKKSYLTLNEDKTVEYYTYISFEEAGDKYIGTYEIEGNFLILSFASHTYSVFDYDTKRTTNIEAKVNTEIRFKIINPKTLENNSYRFIYSA